MKRCCASDILSHSIYCCLHSSFFSSPSPPASSSPSLSSSLGQGNRVDHIKCAPPPPISLFSHSKLWRALPTMHLTFGTTALLPIESQPTPFKHNTLYLVFVVFSILALKNPEKTASFRFDSFRLPHPFHASLAYNRNVILVIIVFAAHRLTSEPWIKKGTDKREVDLKSLEQQTKKEDAVPKKSIGNDLVPELQSKFEVCVHKMHQLRRSRMKKKILQGKKESPPFKNQRPHRQRKHFISMKKYSTSSTFSLQNIN